MPSVSFAEQRARQQFWCSNQNCLDVRNLNFIYFCQNAARFTDVISMKTNVLAVSSC